MAPLGQQVYEWFHIEDFFNHSNLSDFNHLMYKFLNLVLKLTLCNISCSIKTNTSEKSLSLKLFLSTKTCGFLKEVYMLCLPCLWRAMLTSTSNHTFFFFAAFVKCSMINIFKLSPGKHPHYWDSAENKVSVVLPFFVSSKWNHPEVVVKMNDG